MFRRCLALVGCLLFAALAHAQQSGSLPPRWGAVQGNPQFQQPSPYGNYASPSTGGLSSLGSALSNWWNSAQQANPFPYNPNGAALGNSPQNFPPGQPQFQAAGSNQNQGQPNFNGNVGINPQAAARGLRINKGSGTLPNDRGQVWREYDLTPYTARVGGQTRPEQTIIDWIIRETGPDVWFSEPLGILSADSRTLRCYHTPEMQEVVRTVVERFVDSDAEQHVVGLRLVMIGGTNWRARALSLMTPVDIQSEGVEAWLMTKENAAVMFNELRRRTDFRELQVPNFAVQNGMNQVFGRTRPRNYVRSVRLRPDMYPGYEVINGKLEEGFQLQVSPLLSADARVCDVAVKCHIDQVEKMVPLSIDVPAAGGVQSVQIQTPQVVSWRLKERFRWPSDQVLLLSCGIVVNPEPQQQPALGIAIPFVQPGSRSDALLFIEDQGKLAGFVGGQQTPPTLQPSAGTPVQPQPGVVPATTPATVPSVSASPVSRGRY